MALDITNGDVLVVATDEYPIRAVSYWAGAVVMAGFSKLANITATTKRSPAVAAGKIGTAIEYLTGLSCTPLDPVDPELRQRLGLNTPHELLQTFVVDTSGFYQLILEELKL